jgi:hypothetical protein
VGSRTVLDECGEQKLLHAPEFEVRTVQTVQSLYTDLLFSSINRTYCESRSYLSSTVFGPYKEHFTWNRHWYLLIHVVACGFERLIKKTLPNSSASISNNSELNFKVLGSISVKTPITLRGVLSSFSQMLRANAVIVPHYTSWPV